MIKITIKERKEEKGIEVKSTVKESSFLEHIAGIVFLIKSIKLANENENIKMSDRKILKVIKEAMKAENHTIVEEDYE